MATIKSFNVFAKTVKNTKLLQCPWDNFGEIFYPLRTVSKQIPLSNFEKLKNFVVPKVEFLNSCQKYKIASILTVRDRAISTKFIDPQGV